MGWKNGNTQTGYSASGCGGSHGGKGGGCVHDLNGTFTAAAYGSLDYAPTMGYGANGGTDTDIGTGAGGGRITLSVTNTATIAGRVSADGGRGGEGGGGGGGGRIAITADTITYSGQVTARGGGGGWEQGYDPGYLVAEPGTIYVNSDDLASTNLVSAHYQAGNNTLHDYVSNKGLTELTIAEGTHICGGGGGGFITLEALTSMIQSGDERLLKANGGAGYQAGQAGAILVKSPDSPSGELGLDNDGKVYGPPRPPFTGSAISQITTIDVTGGDNSLIDGSFPNLTEITVTGAGTLSSDGTYPALTSVAIDEGSTVYLQGAYSVLNALNVTGGSSAYLPGTIDGLTSLVITGGSTVELSGTYQSLTSVTVNGGSAANLNGTFPALTTLNVTDTSTVQVGSGVPGLSALTVATGSTVDLDGTYNSLASVTINGGSTLSLGSSSLGLSGNWTNTDSTVNGQTSSLELKSLSHSVTGNNTFYDVLCTRQDATLYFGAGDTLTVLNLFRVKGASGSQIRLRSTVDGDAGGDTLAGPNADSLWSITGNDAGLLTSTALTVPVPFSTVESLQGGTDQDAFAFVSPGARLSGSVSGGFGNDVLDHTSYGDVTVALTGQDETGTSGTEANSLGAGFFGINAFLPALVGVPALTEWGAIVGALLLAGTACAAFARRQGDEAT